MFIGRFSRGVVCVLTAMLIAILEESFAAGLVSLGI